METYHVGSGVQFIELSVDITTFGLAASRAIVVKPDSDEPGQSVAHSEDATGDIKTTPIGKARLLRGKRLSVFTKIDLTANDLQERKKEYEQLNATYTLDKGTDGPRTFLHPDKTATDDFYTVFLHFPIDLI